jgi:hypothetical protein
MLFDPKHAERLGGLETQLRRAPAITPDLMADVIVQACVRVHTRGAAARARLSRLIGTGAWTDAVLALVELELPRWQLRRLVCEDGEWHCSLTEQPRLPLELDDAAEAHHENLPLAILLAFVQARCAAAERTVGLTAAPQIRPAAGHAVCCDNFS